MKLKIFKSTVYTIIMVLSMHSYANSQGVASDKEKELEQKLQKMELKLQDMQVKLDSMKVRQKKAVTVYDGDFNKEMQKAFKAIPKAPKAPPMPPLADGWDKTFDKAFKSLDKAMNFNFTFDNRNNKLEEQIKSGEVKQKTKTYSKSYPVDKNDKLQIDNTFGKVTVNTWNKNEFKVDVEIKATAKNDDDAQKILDGVNIEDGKDGSTVSFKTNIEKKDGSNLWGNWTNYVHKVEVNYIIYMPSKNSLDITNKYGGTIIPDFDGKLVINSSYGNFSGKTLTNPANDITSRYGSANIVSLNGSGLKVAYGSLVLGSGDNLNAEISYGSAKIDKIKTSGTIVLKYSGGLRIGDLDKNFKNLSINSSYSSVLIGMDGDPNCDFDVSVRYGSFNYGDHNVNVISKTPADDEHGWTPTKTYKGHIGKGNADKVVLIKSSYGSVKFTDKQPSSL